MTYVQTTAKLDAASHRWLAELAAFKFNIVYRSGKSNANTDILSVLPGETEDQEEQVIDHETIQAIGQACSLSTPLAETLCMSARVLDSDDLKVETTIGLKEMQKQQREDPDISPIFNQVSQGVRPYWKKLSPRTPQCMWLAKEFDRLKIRRGLLYCVTKVDGHERLQVVMPKALHELVLLSLHDDAGHQGRDKTLSLIQDRLYWPGKAADVEAKVRQCDRCIKRRAPTDVKAPLVNIRTSQPLKLVCMDYLTLEQSKCGYQHILVITDQFTRYAQAIPAKDQTAKTMAEALFHGFIVHYGIPHKLHRDQGGHPCWETDP